MQKILNSTLVLLALSTPIFMIANALGGVLIAESKNEFKWEVLKASLIKYLGLLLMAVLLYAGGYLSEKAIEQILNVQLHIKDLILLGIATLALSYAIQAITKFKDLAGIKTTEGDR